MIDLKRLIDCDYYSEPFPILVFENFLNQKEAEDAINSINNQKFDEKVNEGRNNIRKGTKSFENTIKNENILSELYSFFSNKDIFENLLLKLEKVSKSSKNDFKINNKPTHFKKKFFEYKRTVHNKNFLKKISNFISKKIFKNYNYNSFYFEMIFALAEKGYKLKTHRDKENRMVVFLLYLNKLNEQGGSFEVYSKKNDGSFLLERKFSPESGKLIVFLSNPLSYHNVEEITDANSKRFFCYGAYTSLNNIIWKK